MEQKVTLKNDVLTYGEPLSKLLFNEAEFIGDDGEIGRDTEQVEKFAHNVRTEAVHRADVRLLQ